MKAWIAYEKGREENGSIVVFAETASKARANALHFYWRNSDGEVEYMEIRVNRYKVADALYNGCGYMDFDDPIDRRKLCELGWQCSEDYFDPDYCEECSGKDICDRYNKWLKDVEEEE